MTRLLLAGHAGQRAARGTSTSTCAFPGRKPADWADQLRRNAAMLREPGRMKALQRMGRTAPADAGAQLGNVRCPALIVEGTLDPDWADPRAEGEAIVDGACRPASASLAMIEGAGHYPHTQFPDETVALLLPFLAGARPCLGPASTRRPWSPPPPRSPTRSASANVTMGLLAERLGVRAPSLYKHVAGQADLNRRIAVLALTELGDALRDALQGRAGRDALAAAAHDDPRLRHRPPRPLRRHHPPRPPTRPTTRSPRPARGCSQSLTAVLAGYRIDPADTVHALRMLRSLFHGFAMLEAAGGFQWTPTSTTASTG